MTRPRTQDFPAMQDPDKDRLESEANKVLDIRERAKQVAQEQKDAELDMKRLLSDLDREAFTFEGVRFTRATEERLVIVGKRKRKRDPGEGGLAKDPRGERKR